ncbi:hypothetical protein K7G81_11875 [Hephaestia sp. CMS5P-6]|nr:hypothetical protein [Hephaestia mangrovi]
MHPIFYVIAIMGCTDGGQACQQQRVERIHYVTPAACQAAVPDALGRNTDLDYPTIEAACRASGNIMVDNGSKAQQRG